MEQRKVDISYRVTRLQSEILCAQTLLAHLMEESKKISTEVSKETDLNGFRRKYPAFVADLDNWLHHVVQFNCVVESQIDCLTLTGNKPVSSATLSTHDGKKDIIQTSSDGTPEPAQDDQARPDRVDSQPAIQSNVPPPVTDLILLPTIEDSHASSNSIPADLVCLPEVSQIENKLQTVDHPDLETSNEFDEYKSRSGSEENQIHNDLPSTLKSPPAILESCESNRSKGDSRPSSVETLVQNLPPTFYPPSSMEDPLIESLCENDNSQPGLDEAVHAEPMEDALIESSGDDDNSQPGLDEAVHAKPMEDALIESSGDDDNSQPGLDEAANAGPMEDALIESSGDDDNSQPGLDEAANAGPMEDALIESSGDDDNSQPGLDEAANAEPMEDVLIEISGDDDNSQPGLDEAVNAEPMEDALIESSGDDDNSQPGLDEAANAEPMEDALIESSDDNDNSQPGLDEAVNAKPMEDALIESLVDKDNSQPGLDEAVNDKPMEDSLIENLVDNDNSQPGLDESVHAEPMEDALIESSVDNSQPGLDKAANADQHFPSPALKATTVISCDEDAFPEEKSKSTIIIEDSTVESRSSVSIASSKVKGFSDVAPQICSTSDPSMALQEPKQTISGILDNQAKTTLSHTNIATSQINRSRPPRPRMQNRNKVTTNFHNPNPGFFGAPSVPFRSQSNNFHLPSPNAILFRPTGNRRHKPGPIQNGAARPNVISPRAPNLGLISKGPALPTLTPKFPDNLLTFLANSNDWFGLVAHAINPSEFYFHVSSADNEKIDEFHESLNKFYQSFNRVTFVHKWEVHESVGNFCCCLFNDTTTTVPGYGWYRAQVLDWLPDSKEKVVVQLVDYGNKFTAKLADIQPLEKRFAERAVFATRCHLSFLRPPHTWKEWPNTTSAIFRKHLALETMEKTYMISPTGKEESPPFCKLPDPCLNHDKSVPVMLFSDDNYEAVNDYLLDIEFAEYDTQMEVRQVEAMENSHRENLRLKEIEESRRKVEEWCMDENVRIDPKRPSREPSPDFRLSSYNPLSKAKPPPPDEMDEWDPMKEDYENAEMDDEDPCVAVMGYAPTDESRICRHFANSGRCPWGSKCRREHVLSNIHGITTDKEEVFHDAFIQLPMRTNGEHLLIKVTSAQNGYFYAIEESASALEMLNAVINAPANVATYKRLKVLPATSQIVLAKSPKDNRFYRARILSVGLHDAFVCYVDFGNWEEVPEENLREIEPRFMHLAFQAIRLTIFNVELFQEMYDRAAEFLTTEYGPDDVLEAVVVSSDGTTINVLATDNNHNDVGERMIMNGFGSLRDENSVTYWKIKEGNALPG